MLHRIAQTAALWGALLLAGCHARSEAQAATDSTQSAQVQPPAPPVRGTEKVGTESPEQQKDDHGSKWQDSDSDGEGGSGGGFQQFKEAWVYVDGKPVGVLRETELPPIPDVWVDQVEDLDFKAGDPGPHERIYQMRRWRVADYLKAVGVDLSKVKTVLLHGGRGVVNVEGKWFRKYANDLTFDLTGNDNSKLRIFIPDGLNKHINNSFDRYAAISVFVDKPAPTVNQDGEMMLGTTELEGIPYYGAPLRGGIRVYLDGRLAMVIKRNALGNDGKVGDGVWSIGKLLSSRKIDPASIGAVDVVDNADVVTRMTTPVDQLTFTSKSQASGAIMLSSGQVTNALELWSKGKVPATVHQMSPGARDKK